MMSTTAVARPHRRIPERAFFATTVLLLVMLVAPLGGVAQAQDATPVPPSPTPTPAPTPIPAAEIPLRAEQATLQLRGYTEAAEPRGTVASISESLGQLQPKLDRLGDATTMQLEHGASPSELWDLEKRWLREDAVLDSWLATLQARATALEADLGRIRSIEGLWQLTRDSADDQDLPAALRKTVDATIQAAADARTAVSRRRDTVLTMQTEVTGVKADISEAMVPVYDAIAAKRRSVLLPEQPPIWRSIGQPSEPTKTLTERLRDRLSDQSVAVRAYLDDDPRRLLIHAVVFLLLLGVFLALQRWVTRWAAEDDTLRTAAHLVGRPVAAAILLSTLIEAWIHPKAPEAWHNLLEMVLLLALLRLLPQILPRRLAPSLYVLVVLFILWHTLRLVPAELLLYRLVLLGMSAVTLGALLWLARELGAIRDPDHPVWFRNIVRACRVGGLMMAVAILANLIGNVALADLLTEGLMTSVFAALLLWVGAVVVRGAEAIALRTDLAQRLNIVRHSSESIRAVTAKLIRFVAITVWAIYTAAAFGLLRPLTSVIRRMFQHEISIGSVSFSPLSVVSVVFVIWLIFKISKLARFVLETDVLPRVPLPRGVPGTISKITHYIILTVGFFVVIGMLGLDLTKFAIIAGALSVGIGFGLQNVVNNFVSGLILLFERPIKEGDRIELGTTSGVVLKIGMRASVVRTWQGAEVIVPNATLISSELINWTLSDEIRRIEIPIGVAYGSDPDRVLGILLELAREHPDVLEDPVPVSLFVRFGDSSLDFELRAWTTTDFLRVASELRSAINRSLKEAGIEIPFPQRDLHIKSGRPPANEPTQQPSGPQMK